MVSQLTLLLVILTQKGVHINHRSTKERASKVEETLVETLAETQAVPHIQLVGLIVIGSIITGISIE